MSALNEVDTPLPAHGEASGGPVADEDTLDIGAGFDFTDPNSPLARYYLRASHVLAVALLALVFVVLNHVPLWHTDVWGHLKFGEWMVTSGRLPERDPFCPFADAEPGSIHYCWLAQCSFYLLYRGGALLSGGDGLRALAGGVDLLRLGHALTVLLRCVVLLAAFRRLRGSMRLAVLGLVMDLVLSAGHVAIARPQVGGGLCFACVLLALSRPVLSRRALVLLPLLFGLWSNWHSSFAAGLVLLGLWAAGRVLEVAVAAPRGRFRAAAADPQARRLVLALALCAAATLLNPDGPEVYTNLLGMAAHPNVLAMDEWQPLALRLASGGHWVYLAAAGLVVLTPVVCGVRYGAGAVLVAVAFGLQPLRHQRMTLWWVMVTPWLVLPLWARYRRGWAWPRLPESVPSFRKTLLAAVLVLAALAFSVPGEWLLAGKPAPLERCLAPATPWRLAGQLGAPAARDAEWLPALGRWLRERHPGGRLAGPVFASETLGDHLLWALGERPPVFIYTHVHLFAAEHWQRCAEVLFGGPGWRKVLDRHGINLIVVEPDLHPRLRALLRADPEWAVLLDESGRVQKRDPRGRLLVAVRRQPLVVKS